MPVERALSRLSRLLALGLVVILPLAFWTPFLDCFPLAKLLVLSTFGGLWVVDRGLTAGLRLPWTWLWMLGLALAASSTGLPSGDVGRRALEVAILALPVCLLDGLRSDGRVTRRLAVAFTAVATVVAAYGLGQGLGLDPGHWLSPFAKGIASTIGNPDLLGGCLILPLTLALAWVLDDAGLWPVLATVVLGGALLLTEARAAWLGALVAAGLLLRRTSARWTGGLAVLLTLAVTGWLALVPAARARVFAGGAWRERVWTWRMAVRSVRERPLGGTGPGGFRAAYLHEQTAARDRGLATFHYTEYAHSEPLHLAVELGLVGLGVWLWVLAGAFRLWRDSPLRARDPALWRGIGAGGAGVLANALLSFPFHVPPTIVPLALLLGSAGAAAPSRRGPVRPFGPRARLAALGLAAAVLGLLFAVAVPNAWLRVGQGLALNGRPAEALTAYDRAALLGTGDVRLSWYAASAARAAGQPDRARAHLQRALTRDPDMYELWHELGMTERAAGRLPEAEAAYRQSLRINPEFPHSWNNLGNVLGLEGKLGAAEAAQRRALALLPESPEARQNLAVTLLRERRPAEARRIMDGGAP